METHQSVCEWDGDTLDVYISTQYIWGVRDDVAEQLGLPPDKVRVVCEFMGGGFGSKNGPGDYTFIAAELAKRTGRPGTLRARRGARRTSPPATATRRSSGSRVGARSDGTLDRARRRVRERDRLGRLVAPTDGPDADALRLRERPHRRLPARS